MPSYFAEQLAHTRAKSERELTIRFNQIFAENSAAGNLLSGSTVIRHREAVAAEMDAFGNNLIQALTTFPPDHSPIKRSDFTLAKEAVVDFQCFAEDRCAELLAKIGRLLPTGLIDEMYLDGADARVAVSLKIEGYEHEYKSRLSFWKWAAGDVKKRLWSLGLVAVGWFIGHVFQTIWNHTASFFPVAVWWSS